MARAEMEEKMRKVWEMRVAALLPIKDWDALTDEQLSEMCDIIEDDLDLVSAVEGFVQELVDSHAKLDRLRIWVADSG